MAIGPSTESGGNKLREFLRYFIGALTTPTTGGNTKIVIMNKIGLILIFISHISSGMYAQDLCKKEYGMEKKGQVSIGSTVFEGFIKQGIRYDASEFACNIEYWKTQNLVFTINQQPDLIYFESYYDTTHLHIQSQGYYRLVYLDSEIGYCWLKDLVWNQYSPSGHITKKEFFYKNELKEAPYMPQPSSK